MENTFIVIVKAFLIFENSYLNRDFQPVHTVFNLSKQDKSKLNWRILPVFTLFTDLKTMAKIYSEPSSKNMYRNQFLEFKATFMKL